MGDSAPRTDASTLGEFESGGSGAAHGKPTDFHRRAMARIRSYNGRRYASQDAPIPPPDEIRPYFGRIGRVVLGWPGSRQRGQPRAGGDCVEGERVSTVALPNWTPSGVLPPIDSVEPTSANRSPYRVSLADFVLRFGSTKERCAILDGLLRYRAALHAAGLVTGFQWVDGSFLEHVEQVAGRPPNDVDVVTFFRIAAGDTQDKVLKRNPDLFDQAKVKQNYKVDGYLVLLDGDASVLVANSAYWYGVWSHRRDQTWKGFVEVDLTPAETPANDLLQTLTAPGGTT